MGQGISGAAEDTALSIEDIKARLQEDPDTISAEEIVEFTRLIESDGDGATDAVVSGNDLTFAFGKGDSITLGGGVPKAGLDALIDASVDFGGGGVAGDNGGAAPSDVASGPSEISVKADGASSFKGNAGTDTIFGGGEAGAGAIEALPRSSRGPIQKAYGGRVAGGDADDTDVSAPTTSGATGVSNDAKPNTAGDTLFAWNTASSAGKEISQADVAHLNPKYYSNHKVVAEDEDTFTVTPSTSGHEGQHAAFNIDPTRDAVLSYTAEFSDATDFKLGGKLMGLYFGEGASGGNSRDDGGSARLMWRENGELSAYLYHQDQPSKYGEDVRTGIFVKPGEAFDVDLVARANDAGQKNGGFDLYINGQLAAGRDDLMFTKNGASITSVSGDIFWGGQGSEWEANAGAAVTISGMKASKAA